MRFPRTGSSILRSIRSAAGAWRWSAATVVSLRSTCESVPPGIDEPSSALYTNGLHSAMKVREGARVVKVVVVVVNRGQRRQGPRDSRVPNPNLEFPSPSPHPPASARPVQNRPALMSRAMTPQPLHLGDASPGSNRSAAHRPLRVTHFGPDRAWSAAVLLRTAHKGRVGTAVLLQSLKIDGSPVLRRRTVSMHADLRAVHVQETVSRTSPDNSRRRLRAPDGDR